jgi:hypothetical protein
VVQGVITSSAESEIRVLVLARKKADGPFLYGLTRSAKLLLSSLISLLGQMRVSGQPVKFMVSGFENSAR